jgi:hypothetical protein
MSCVIGARTATSFLQSGNYAVSGVESWSDRWLSGSSLLEVRCAWRRDCRSRGGTSLEIDTHASYEIDRDTSSVERNRIHGRYRLRGRRRYRANGREPGISSRCRQRRERESDLSVRLDAGLLRERNRFEHGFDRQYGMANGHRPESVLRDLAMGRRQHAIGSSPDRDVVIVQWGTPARRLDDVRFLRHCDRLELPSHPRLGVGRRLRRRKQFLER